MNWKNYLEENEPSHRGRDLFAFKITVNDGHVCWEYILDGENGLHSIEGLVRRTGLEILSSQIIEDLTFESLDKERRVKQKIARLKREVERLESSLED